MIGVDFAKAKLLSWSRQTYNSGKFGSSIRWSRTGYFFFRDRENLDILARSYLRKKRFSKASKCYRMADRRGFSLLEHELNQFKSEIGSENYVRAYRSISKMTGKRIKNKCISELVRRLKRTTDSERVSVINEMNEISPLPLDISRLLPWAPDNIEYEETGDDYTTLRSEPISAKRYQRELTRIRSSGAYRISNHITSSVRSPTKALKLPFTLPRLIIDLILSRTGKIGGDLNEINVINSSESRRNCILLFPTNGVGFGHFTRLLSVSRAIKKQSPNTEIVFFTTMPTLHVPSEEGIICYHMPGRYRYEGMTASQWNAMCEEMLALIFTLHRPKAFIFDGAYPYRGMLNAIKANTNNVFKIWLRRGAIKKGSKGIPVDSIGHFNAIIRPGDSVEDDFQDELKHNIPIKKTPPITIDSAVQKQKSPLRSRLGIPKEALVCYVQLGAGRINDIESEIAMTLKVLSKYEQIYTVVGESMLGERIPNLGDRTRVLRDYPNSMYFSEFDFAVIAGGYNSYHEVISSGLPSICFPNLNTGRDDQLARAKAASNIGAMIVLESRNEASIEISVQRMILDSVRIDMKEKISSIQEPNGSDEAAIWILNQISN